jgi:glycosyltransferase involved in cell wall biosynthesis
VSVPFSGIEVYFHALETFVSKREDIDATWIYIGWESDESFSSIPLLSGNWTLRASHACRVKIRRLEGSGKTFDVAFFNSIVPLLGLGGFLRRTPALLTVDATPTMLDRYHAWYGRPEGLFARAVSLLGDAIHTKKMYRAMNGIFAWSPLVMKSLVNDYGVPEHNITVVPPGLDLSRWERYFQGGQPREAQTSRPQILFVGRDFHRKGGDLVFDIACLPEFAACDFHFVTGWKPTGRPPSNVFLHHGLAPNSDELIGLYGHADVLVLPTRADFYPTNACCEAMAMGLPVITTNVGGMEYLLNEGEGGFVVPPDDRGEFVKRLSQLIEDPDLRYRCGRRNRRYAEEHFDLEKNSSIIVRRLALAGAGRNSLSYRTGEDRP